MHSAILIFIKIFLERKIFTGKSIAGNKFRFCWSSGRNSNSGRRAASGSIFACGDYICHIKINYLKLYT